MGLPGDPVAKSDQLMAALGTWANLAAAMKVQLLRSGFSDAEAFSLVEDWMRILVADASEMWTAGMLGDET